MKKISLIMTLVMIISAFVPVAYAAGTEVEYMVFTDFENWDKAVSQYPGAEWTTVSPALARIQPIHNEEKNGTVMEIQSGGEPLVKFAEFADKGQIHISFDMKQMNAATTRVFFAFYDGTNNTTLTDYGDRSYMSKMIVTNKDTKNEHYYYYDGTVNSMVRDNWKSVPTKSFDSEQWHRYDIILGEISSGSTAYANYYVDGELINENPVPFSNSKGFKAFFIRPESNGGGSVGSVLIDNFYMRHFTGDAELKGSVKDGNNIDFENAILDVSFFETIEAWDEITVNDIDLTRESDGYRLTDFELVSVSEQGVKIKINETLQPGKYNLIFSDNVKGMIYKTAMSEPITFRTKYEKELVIGTTYANQNFNDYSEEAGTPPANWLYFGDSVNTVKPGTGKDGTGMVLSRVKGLPRTHYAFTTPIPKATDYSVEFDIKHNGGQWFMSLLENRDMQRSEGVNFPGTTDKDHWNSNIAVGMNAGDSALGYASVRSNTTVQSIGTTENAPLVSADAWHHIKVHVGMNTSTTVKYTVSVDGGAEFEVISERAFATENTTGIAFSAKGAGSEICVDNLKIYDEIFAMYPEVEDIQYVRCGDILQSNKSKLSTATERIDVIFNDTIATANIENNVQLLKNGVACQVRYEFGEGGKIISLYPERGLDAATDYVVSVSNNISSSKLDTLKIKNSYSQNIHTLNDAGFNIYQTELTEGADTANITINAYKTDNSSGKYTLVAASYKTATDENGVSYEELIGIDYIPLEFAQSDKGFYEYSAVADKPFDTEYVKAYLWEYPSQISVFEKEGE